MIISLLYLLIAIIPVLLYIGVIWSTTPISSFNIRGSYLHFISGVVSVGIIFTYFRLFPDCHKSIAVDYSLSIFFLSFVQVALVEELCKFISFKMGEMLRGTDTVFYDKPVATMFYSGVTALGFAFIENVTYALQYGGEVLVSRSFVAMLLHFLCGMIMGYWIAASRLPTKLKNSSHFEMLCIKKPIIKKLVYYTLAILSAVFIHGLYDYNIFTKGHITSNYLIIFSGVIATYLAAKDLNERQF